MYVLVCRVGNTFGVLDTADGSVEWFKKNDIFSFIQNGVKIDGVNGTVFKPIPTQISWTLCNWVNGQNIFKVGKFTTIRRDASFEFRAGSKLFKGKVILRTDFEVTLKFSFGVIVTIPLHDFNVLCSN